MSIFNNFKFAERIVTDALVAAGIKTLPLQSSRLKSTATQTLPEIAKELQLEIDSVRLDRGVYHGICFGVHGHQALVRYRTKGAIIVDLSVPEEGQEMPRTGEVLQIEMSNGRAKVTFVRSN